MISYSQLLHSKYTPMSPIGFFDVSMTHRAEYELHVE